MYVLYIRYVSSSYSSYLIRSTLYNLSYYSSLYGSTGSILNYALINQLASSNSSPSSRNIVLKASVIVGVRGNNLLNLIRASVLLIKFFNRLFYIQISYIQLDKVTNLVGQYQGSFLICCGFIDKLGPYYFISKKLLQFLYLLYKFIYFYNL